MMCNILQIVLVKKTAGKGSIKMTTDPSLLGPALMVAGGLMEFASSSTLIRSRKKTRPLDEIEACGGALRKAHPVQTDNSFDDLISRIDQVTSS